MVRPDPVDSEISANQKVHFSWGIAFLECFSSSRCITRRHGRTQQLSRLLLSFLSTFTNLNRWNYTSNGKKEWYSFTWSGATKLGFVEFNIAFTIPKMLTTLNSATCVQNRSHKSCFVQFGHVSFTAVRWKTVLKFQLSNTLCFLSYVGYLRAQMCCNLPCKFTFQGNVYLQYFTV